jgi:hypothetical protein
MEDDTRERISSTPDEGYESLPSRKASFIAAVDRLVKPLEEILVMLREAEKGGRTAARTLLTLALLKILTFATLAITVIYLLNVAERVDAMARRVDGLIATAAELKASAKSTEARAEETARKVDETAASQPEVQVVAGTDGGAPRAVVVFRSKQASAPAMSTAARSSGGSGASASELSTGADALAGPVSSPAQEPMRVSSPAPAVTVEIPLPNATKKK